MGLEYSDVQVAFLDDPKKVDALAEWIIHDTSNTYSKHLRKAVSVPQTLQPSREDITAVKEYLVDPSSDVGMVARLINSYLYAQRAH